MTEFDIREDIAAAIQDTMVQVVLSISSWKGAVLDRTATANLRDSTGARHGAAQVQKKLMAGSQPEFKKLEGILRQGRLMHNHMTLPWSIYPGKGAPRLLPATHVMDYLKLMRDTRNEFRAALDELSEVWEERVSGAREALAKLDGELGDPAHYPSIEQLRQRFQMEYHMEPLPAVSQFPGMLPPNLIAGLQRQVGDRMVRAVNDAQLRLAQQVADEVMDFSRKLQRRVDGERTRIADGSIDGLKRISRLLGACDVFGDPRFKQLQAELDDALEGLSNESLRKDVALATSSHQRFQSVLSTLASWDVLPNEKAPDTDDE